MNRILEWFVVGLLLVIFGSIVLELDANVILGNMIVYIAIFAVIADYMEW
jgi:hypothetical protein